MICCCFLFTSSNKLNILNLQFTQLMIFPAICLGKRKLGFMFLSIICVCTICYTVQNFLHNFILIFFQMKMWMEWRCSYIYIRLIFFSIYHFIRLLFRSNVYFPFVHRRCHCKKSHYLRAYSEIYSRTLY